MYVIHDQKAWVEEERGGQDALCRWIDGSTNESMNPQRRMNNVSQEEERMRLEERTYLKSTAPNTSSVRMTVVL